jgi:hypothetical protein
MGLIAGFSQPISLTLKIEAISSSETSVVTRRPTRRHVPEDDTLQENFYFTILGVGNQMNCHKVL